MELRPEKLLSFKWHLKNSKYFFKSNFSLHRPIFKCLREIKLKWNITRSYQRALGLFEYFSDGATNRRTY